MKKGRGGQRPPPPPPENKAARWGGSGERVRDGPHDRARRKHAPCKPQRGGTGGANAGWEGRRREQHGKPPPPCRGTSAAPRACAVLATCLRRRTDSEGAPPPPPSPPPTKERSEDGEEVARRHGGGTEDRPTCQGKRRADGGGDAKKKNHEQSKPTRQRKKAGRQGPKPRRTGGGRGNMGPQETLVKYPTTGKSGPQRGTPPPTATASPCACVVLPSCLRHACYKGKTTRATRATRGMTVAERGPPPEDTAAGWGGKGERVRDGPHDRAQTEHAPCKPQQGEPPGVNRRKGRVTTGATWQAPPPLQRDKCRASCLRPACDVLTPEDGQRGRPPPPPPSPPPTQERGEDSEETARGHGGRGGAEDRPKRRGERRVASGRGKKKTKKQRTPTRQSRGRQQRQTGHGKSQEARQGARERGTPLGKKAGRQGQTPQRTGGGRGDKSPQKTLVRYPTSGVWGPPRCPYRPHLSAGNKVGYARDRWPAARGGTGLGGWPMGLTKSTPHGTYCGSCPVRGCG